MPDPLPSWSDSPSTSSPLDAANLNEYTTAVADNQTAIATLQSNVSTLTSNVTTLQAATNVNSVTASDSSITVAGTATAPTVKVAQANLTLAQSQVTGLSTSLNNSAQQGGIWDFNVFGDLMANMCRDDAISPYQLANRTQLVLLGLAPAGTYSTVRLGLITAGTGAGVMAAALYGSTTIGATSWARLGSGNVAPAVNSGATVGMVSTALAFTLAVPTFVMLQLVATTAYTAAPFFAGTIIQHTTLTNPASGTPVSANSAATTAPATTLNPTTGFTNVASKIWCALA